MAKTTVPPAGTGIETGIEIGIETGPFAACGETAACYQAVTRTYGLLKQAGAREQVAYEAAEKVYAWHHPEVPRRQVPFVIAEWLP